jgi:asparagine N-glycosylation enzyme membrane subunit Stt3
MFVFDPFVLVFWVFLGFFIPGAIFSLAILGKKELPFIDKVLIGFAVGLVIPPLFAFLAFLAGIPFTQGIAVASIILFYLISIALFVKEKAWEGILPHLKLPSDYHALGASAAILIIVFLAFFIRMQTYGPVFMELDPYYYIQHTALILTQGGAPLEDTSAWWPHITSHRGIPLKAYSEAITYALYNSNTEFDRYMLSAVAGMLPPILAALFVFFVYLIVSSEYKRMFGIAAAGVAAFMPMIVMKLMAGESEVQPFGFFGVAFFIAMYALAIKRKDLTFAFLAGLAFFATMLMSSSASVIFTALFVFIPLQAIFLFAIKEDLKKNAILNGIVLAGAIVATVLGSIFTGGFSPLAIFSGQLLTVELSYLFLIALFVLNEKMPNLQKEDLKKAALPIGALALVGLALIFFTPVGAPILSMGKSLLGIAQFNLPLHKTIAEQGLAGASFESELGFAAMSFTNLPELGKDPFIGGIQHIFALFTGICTYFANIMIGATVAILDKVFGTDLVYSNKDNSILMAALFLFVITMAYSIYTMFKTKEQRLAILFLAFVFPVSIIGLFKTKYVVYMGFAVAVAIGIVLGSLFEAVNSLISKMEKENKRKEYLNYAFIAFAAICFLFIWFEWSNGIGGALFESSFQTRFQDDPVKLQPKMDALCKASGYAPACVAAANPEVYASKGIKEQYSSLLCVYSLFQDPAAPKPAEQLAASLRCNELDSYWIEFTEWQFNQSPIDARFTSWWDYGHWTNYFGQRDTVLRNDHAYDDMIMDVAHAFIYGTPAELKSIMQEHGSEYVFYDREIIYNADGSFGGKFHALNYLSCSRNNETSVKYNPGQSQCEANHRWESVAIPTSAQPCTISQISGKTGVLVYDAYTGTPVYCAAEITLATGETILGTYSMNETYENGDLKLHKALLRQIGQSGGANVYDVYYTKDSIWLENGELKSGWEDRTTKFYDSTLYQGFVLQNLEGFTQAYQTSDGAVKCYKMN